MNAKQCDRCGKLYNPRGVQKPRFKITDSVKWKDQYNHASTWDLCPSCDREIGKFLDEPEEVFNQGVEFDIEGDTERE